MRANLIKIRWAFIGIIGFVFLVIGVAFAQEMVKTSYSPVVIKEPFKKSMVRMKNAKSGVMERQMDLLNERYDMSNRTAEGVMMSGGTKAIQEGVRVILPDGLTWHELANMSSDEIKEKDLWPKGFYPLPHPGMRRWKKPKR